MPSVELTYDDLVIIDQALDDQVDLSEQALKQDLDQEDLADIEDYLTRTRQIKDKVTQRMEQGATL